MRFLHFWYPVIFGLIYALFSLFYYLAGGTNHNGKPYIYPALNWENPGTAVLYCVIIVIIALPVVHFILYGIHVLKLYIYHKCECCQADIDLMETREVEMKQPEY